QRIAGFLNLERVMGLKPTAFALARRRSNQLSYTRMIRTHETREKPGFCQQSQSVEAVVLGSTSFIIWPLLPFCAATKTPSPPDPRRPAITFPLLGSRYIK